MAKTSTDNNNFYYKIFNLIEHQQRDNNNNNTNDDDDDDDGSGNIVVNDDFNTSCLVYYRHCHYKNLNNNLKFDNQTRICNHNNLFVLSMLYFLLLSSASLSFVSSSATLSNTDGGISNTPLAIAVNVELESISINQYDNNSTKINTTNSPKAALKSSNIITSTKALDDDYSTTTDHQIILSLSHNSIQSNQSLAANGTVKRDNEQHQQPNEQYQHLAGQHLVWLKKNISGTELNVLGKSAVKYGRRKRVVWLSSAAAAADSSTSSSSSSSSFSSSSSSSTSIDSIEILANKNNREPTIMNERNTGTSDDQRESAYVCEDGQLVLSCATGKHIDVLRANFGRFSIALCNPTGFLDWSVNCASGNSILPLLTERCANRNKCSIEASSSIFGDPCPGTSKYLEVHYRCTSGLERMVKMNQSSIGSALPKLSSLDNNLMKNKPSDTNLSATSLWPWFDRNKSFNKQLINNRSNNVNYSSIHSINDIITVNNATNNSELKKQQQQNSSSNNKQPQQQHTSMSFNNGEENNSITSNNNNNNNDQLLLHNANFDNSFGHNNNNDINGNGSRINNNNNKQQKQQSEFSKTMEAKYHDKDVNDLFQLSSFSESSSSSIININANSNNNSHQQWPMGEILPESTSTSLSATCEPIIYRNIHWPPTLTGSMAIRPCPHDASGLAQWKCGDIADGSMAFENYSDQQPYDNHFSNLDLTSPETSQIQQQQHQQPTSAYHRASWMHSPDLSQCVSRWLLQLHSFQNVNNYRNDIWRTILANLERLTTVYGGDILQLIGILNNWSIRYFDGNDRFQNYQHPINGLDTIIDIVSQLMSFNHRSIWFDLPIFKRESAAFQLMDSTARYAALYCLNQRSNFVSEYEVIKQSNNLVVSCFSFSKVLQQIELDSDHKLYSNQEFSLKLFSNLKTLAHSFDNKVEIYLILNVTNIFKQKLLFNEHKIYFSMLMPLNLENYFQLSNQQINDFNVETVAAAARRTLLNNELHQTTIELSKDQHHNRYPSNPDTFINGQVVRLVQFNDEQIMNGQWNIGMEMNGNKLDSLLALLDNNYLPNDYYYAFEIIFKHLIKNNENIYRHQCVHWDKRLNHWSNEHCLMIQSNVTHSVCRCTNILPIFTLLAISHHNQFKNRSLNHSMVIDEWILSKNRNSKTGQVLNELTMGKYGDILSLLFIIYMWLALVLIRYFHRKCYFGQSNFLTLLIIVLVRTLIELSTTLTTNGRLWYEWLIMRMSTTHDYGITVCRTGMFIVISQLQLICSLLTVFIFSNVILLILANKIYLTKNYINSLKALKSTKNIQLLIAITIPLIHLLALYSLGNNNINHNNVYDKNCWPQFEPLVTSLFVTGPVLQITLIITAGIIYLHCSQRIFSEYDYATNMQYNIQSDTSSMEKHIKLLFFNRCKYSSIWIVLTVIYFILVVGCLCCSLLNNNITLAFIAIDIGISLTFLLFVPMKNLYDLFIKCHRSSSRKNVQHCYNGVNMGQESASSSIDSKQTRDNSISILSDTSKTLLTLPGQMSLGSPKIYPNTHQSSCVYAFNANSSNTINIGNDNNSNPSSHLYESPSHLYNYEFDQRYNNGNGTSRQYPPTFSHRAAYHSGHQKKTLHHHQIAQHAAHPFYAMNAMPGVSSIQRHSAIRDSNMSLNRIRNHPNVHHTTSRIYSPSFDRTATSKNNNTSLFS